MVPDYVDQKLRTSAVQEIFRKMERGIALVEIPPAQLKEAATALGEGFRYVVKDHGLPDLSSPKSPPLAASAVMRALVMLRAVYRYEMTAPASAAFTVRGGQYDGRVVKAPTQEELCSEREDRDGLLRQSYIELNLDTLGYTADMACSGAPHIQAAAATLAYAGLMMERKFSKSTLVGDAGDAGDAEGLEGVGDVDEQPDIDVADEDVSPPSVYTGSLETSSSGSGKVEWDDSIPDDQVDAALDALLKGTVALETAPSQAQPAGKTSRGTKKAKAVAKKQPAVKNAVSSASSGLSIKETRVPYGILPAGRILSFWMFGDEHWLVKKSVQGFSGLKPVVVRSSGERYSEWFRFLGLDDLK